MANILIAGCGYVGTRLALRLRDECHCVWGLRRSQELLPEGIRTLQADLLEPSSLEVLPEEIDYLCYSASADGFSEESYHKAYVRGLENLLQRYEAGQTLPKRLVFTSSTSVYAQKDGSWVDENSPTEPSGFSGSTILKGEKLALNSAIPGVVIRLGGIYGAERTSLLRSVQSGEAKLREGSSVVTNRIHVEDCAGAIHHLMLHENPAALYIGVDETPVERNELLNWMASQLGVSLQTSSATETRSSRGLRSNKRCSNKRLLESGYRFCYPSYREGYGEIISKTAAKKLKAS